MHGLTVNIPDGYTGLVLHTAPEDASDTRAAPTTRTGAPAKANTHGRTRRASQREAMDIDADVGAEPPRASAEEGVRALRPGARFASFVLWSQDVPVDAGRDEYLRAVREWTRLAAEVRARSCLAVCSQGGGA